METDKLLEILLSEVRELNTRMSSCDATVAALVTEVRTTQLAEKEQLQAVQATLGSMQSDIDELRAEDTAMKLSQMELRTKVAVPASVAGLLTAITAVISNYL